MCCACLHLRGGTVPGSLWRCDQLSHKESMLAAATVSHRRNYMALHCIQNWSAVVDYTPAPVEINAGLNSNCIAYQSIEHQMDG